MKELEEKSPTGTVAVERSGLLAIFDMNYQSDEPIWKSHVWNGGKCFLVSTIERSYDTFEGETRGTETLVWEYDWENRKRGNLIHQGDSVDNHQAICRCLIAEGVTPNEDNPKHERFFS